MKHHYVDIIYFYNQTYNKQVYYILSCCIYRPSSNTFVNYFLWTKLKQNISFNFLSYIYLIQSFFFYTYFLFCFHSVIFTSPHSFFFLQATCILTEIFLWPHASRCWPSVIQSQLGDISWAHCTKPLLSLNPSHTYIHSVPMATVLVWGISNE